MNKSFKLRRATLLLALALPSLCWGFGSPRSALIVTETGSAFQTDINAVVAFLSSRLVAASYGVTTNVGVPAGSLAGYNQVWDIRAERPLTGPEITAYVTYMAGGGGLFVMGENVGCCGSRDNSIISLISAAGGGAVTVASDSSDTQTVHAPFTGPVSLASLTYAAAGDYTSIGAGAFITTDTSTTGASIIFGPGTMTNAAAGALASVLDINFMDTAGGGQGLSQPLTDNLIAYLGAPTVIPSSGATSFTFAGPTGGTINAASTNFTVTPNAAYTGTITLTPSGGGLSTATVLTFSGSSTAQTFTVTPTAAGPVTLTPSNSGSLTNPVPLTYATPPSAPTIGVATPGSGSASVAFTVPTTTGGSPITSYTATCNPGAINGTGASSPVTVSGLTPGSNYTCSVTATNTFGVSAASAASNQVTAGATGFTLTGPTGGAVSTASGNFTVTPNAPYTGTITITPVGGGLSTAIVLTFTASVAAQTFTITPNAIGPVTLTPTNSTSLTNPAVLSYATPSSAPTIGAATPGSGAAFVAFTPPANTGGAAITLYTATCSPGNISGTSTTSPVRVGGLASGSTYTCTVTATNAAGVSAASGASNQVTIPASGFTFTGPASGAINSASGNFTVTPNAPFTGTITITPSGGGLSATIGLTFDASTTAQTFTITPTAVGPVTLTPANSGSLPNPGTLSYATPSSAPTIGTATPTAGGASVAFTAPASTGGAAITSYTATCSPGGISGTGSASPISVTGLTPGSSYTCSVTATNSAGTSAASSPSNQVAVPATGYTLTGPAGGLINNQSGVFTITPNSAFTGNITISVSGGGATAAIVQRSGTAKGGPRAAIVRSFSNSSAPQTFTITPTSVGPVTVTATNNASLANPPALNYATQPGVPVIGTATPSGGSVVVTFTPPSSGGSPITSYTATCTGGATATGPSSPLTVPVSGAATGVTCTVTASNTFGVSAVSSPSNTATPSLTATPAPATLGLVMIGAAALYLWSRRRGQLA